MIRILLAENNETLRVHLTRMLEHAGYMVVAVADGATAVPYLEGKPFDLLLCDIVMPEIGGIELARHCERISPDTRIVLITGFAAVSLRVARDVPQAKLLSPSFHLRELVFVVGKMFDRRAEQSG